LKNNKSRAEIKSKLSDIRALAIYWTLININWNKNFYLIYFNGSYSFGDLRAKLL